MNFKLTLWKGVISLVVGILFINFALFPFLTAGLGSSSSSFFSLISNSQIRIDTTRVWIVFLFGILISSLIVYLIWSLIQKKK